jgi:hypothetical protein
MKPIITIIVFLAIIGLGVYGEIVRNETTEVSNQPTTSSDNSDNRFNFGAK